MGSKVSNNLRLPLELLAIADVYDALTHERPYKPAYSHDEAVSQNFG